MVNCYKMRCEMNEKCCRLFTLTFSTFLLCILIHLNIDTLQT